LDFPRTATSLEKCKALYSRYDSGNCDEGLYSVAATAISPSAFLLTATPVAGGRQASDTDCTELTLTSSGIKSGDGADVTECW